eukprot:jgi/Bigna1/68087/fgenesh1_pg.5_\
MVWELSGADSKHWFPLTCEGIINGILVGDVVLDIYSQGWETYVHDRLNVLDLSVTITCVSLFLALLARRESTGVYDSELSHLDIAFLTLRYLFMIFRIWVLFRKVKRQDDHANQEDVQFPKGGGYEPVSADDEG